MKQLRNKDITQKAIMSAMGGLWVIYLTIHALTSLSFFSKDVFNDIYIWLNNGIFWRFIVPAMLVISLIYHMFIAIKKQLSNLNKQPKYHKPYPKAIPRLIAWSGVLVIVVFLLLHIYQMQTLIDENIHQQITALFENPIISGFYIIATIPLIFHIHHGLSNINQSFGVQKHFPKILLFSILFILAIGYILPPLMTIVGVIL